jgi:Tfp pilus assembly protein PilV
MEPALTRWMRAAVRRLHGEQGTTLIETTIACGILLVSLAGLMSIGTLATMHTENQGHLAPRTTEYAQDKMEQMLALAYSDASSNTVVFPSATLGGSGLAIGGSTNTAAPVNLYVDWLAQNGDLLGGGTTQPASWFYERVWQVTCASASYVPAAATATPAPQGLATTVVPVPVLAFLPPGSFLNLS